MFSGTVSKEHHAVTEFCFAHSYTMTISLEVKSYILLFEVITGELKFQNLWSGQPGFAFRK